MLYHSSFKPHPKNFHRRPNGEVIIRLPEGEVSQAVGGRHLVVIVLTFAAVGDTWQLRSEGE